MTIPCATKLFPRLLVENLLQPSSAAISARLFPFAYVWLFFLMCSDNWIETMSSDCCNFSHSSKTMERVNYRIVEEGSWDSESLTIDVKHNHFQTAFYTFPRASQGTFLQCQWQPQEKVQNRPVWCLHWRKYPLCREPQWSEKQLCMLAWSCHNKETDFEA